MAVSPDVASSTGVGLPHPMAGKVCETCRSSLKFCLSCSEQIRGQFLEFDGVGPYCAKCYKERPACDVCTAPLTREHWLLSDGRTMCTYCHATAVFEVRDATDLYSEMKTIVAQLLGLTLNVPTGLALVDRNQLAEVIRGVIDAQTAAGAADVEELDAQRTLGIYARKGMRRGIYVQTGLPRLLFLQVAAHEYAHAWQGENCPLLTAVALPGASEQMSPEAVKLAHEGFAEWIAYQVLGKYGYRRGQERMLARTDIYGQGLRWALNVEKSCGTQGVLDACRTANMTEAAVLGFHLSAGGDLYRRAARLRW
jgi:hypothetical protein